MNRSVGAVSAETAKRACITGQPNTGMRHADVLLRSAALASTSALALLIGALPAAQAGERITSGGGAGGGGVAWGLFMPGGAGGLGGGGGGGGESWSGGPGGAGGDGGKTGSNSGVGNGGTPGTGGAAGGSGRDWDGGGGGGSTPKGPGSTGGTGGAGGEGNIWIPGQVPPARSYWGASGGNGSQWAGGGGGGAGLYLIDTPTFSLSRGHSIIGGNNPFDPVATGFGGGGGGAGLVLQRFGGTLNNDGAEISGGSGGLGSNGGGGGAGLFLVDGGNLNNGGSITGGAGGQAAGIIPQLPATGGAGGAGVLANGGNHINRAIITGGAGSRGDFAGGAGGAGMRLYGDPYWGWGSTGISNEAGATITGGDGGATYRTAGQGGDGITFDNNPGRASIDNSGIITGGNGGTYEGAVGIPDPKHGAGGVGVRITADYVSLTNSGTIAGGLNGDGTTRASAVEMTGNNNTLAIFKGAVFNGGVVAQGTGNRFVLKGSDSATLDLPATIQGFQSVKEDSGTWTLNGVGSQGWTVSDGTLKAGNAGAFGTSGAYAVNGGTLDLSGFDLSVSSLSGTGGTVALGASSLTVDQNIDTRYQGKLTGSGGLTKRGTGTLTLSGNNGYTGDTTIATGTLQIDDSATLGTGTVRFEGGTLAGNFTGTLSNKLVFDNFASAIAATTGNTLTLGGEIEVRQSFNFGQAGFGGTVVFDPTQFSATGQIIFVQGGTLKLGSSNAVQGLLDLPVFVAKDAVFDINDRPNAEAALLAVEGTVLTGQSTDTVLAIAAGEVRGGITGAGSLEVRDVGNNYSTSLILSGTGLNTYAGSTHIFSGHTLLGGAANALNARSATTVDALGTLDLGGFNQEIASLAGAGIVTNSASTAASLTVGGDQTTTTFSGEIKNGTGKLGLTKVGTGTLTLSGANSYTGDTTVTAGTLLFSARSILGDVTVNAGTLYLAQGGTLGNVVVNSGTLTFGGNGTLGNVTINGAGALEATETLTLDLTGNSLNLSNTATIGATAGKTLTIQSNFNVAATVHIGTSTNTGTVALTKGTFSPASRTATLSIDNGTLTGDAQALSSFGNLAGVSIAKGAAFDVAGTSVLLPKLTGFGTVRNSDPAQTALLVIGANFSGPVADSSTFDGTIEDGAGQTGLVKAGLGTFTLTGTNIYTGDTTAGDGVLQIGNGGTTGSIVSDLVIYGELAFNRADGVIFGGKIDGSGNLSQIGAGTTQLTGDSSGYTGTISVGHGTLQVANALGGNARVNGGTLEVNGTLGGSVLATGPGRVAGKGTILGDVDFVTQGGGVLEGRQDNPLTIGGALQLDKGTTTEVALGRPSGAVLFDVGGSLVLDGTLNITDMGGFGAGVYRLFSYGGLLVDNGLEFGTLPGGVNVDNLTLQTGVFGQINLVSTAGVALSFWDGGDILNRDNGSVDGDDGAWRADGRNWTDANGTINGPFQPNPTYAIFQGTAGTVTVDDGAGAVGITGMQLMTDGYRIEGDAVMLQGDDGESIIRVGNGKSSSAGTKATIVSELTGATRLVKGDYGTLILDGINSYIGGTEIRTGTLQVSRDENLGILAGALNFTGGTLNTTASFDTQRGISLASDGVFDVASTTTLGLAGAVSGSGNLIKKGSGTLALTGAGAYGNTFVEAGTLVGNAASISGNIGNAATLVFDQAGNGSFAGAITALGATKGTMVKRGTGTLTLTGRSSLDWSVEAGTLVASAERFGGNVLIGAGGSFGFDQADDASYAGALSGQGHFAKTGAGALKLTGDSSGFAGSTSIANGTLSVDGSLGGVIDVLAGGRLQGKGTIGSLKVAAGSTIAPGNSIGTLNIAGDVAFAAGSTYEVEIAGNGASDRIVAGGKATLGGGKVAVTALDAKTSYQEGQRYTILTAAGGIIGGFDPAVLARSAFLDATLLQGANAVDLRISVKTSKPEEPGGPGEPGQKPVFVKAANTDNQTQTAGALDTLQQSGAPLALYNTLLVLSADEARAAFDSLSGEVHASTVTGLLEDSRFVRDAVNDRLRSAFETVGGLPLMAYGNDAKEITTASVASERYGAWGSVFGSWGHFGSDGNAARLSRSTGGFVTGVDGLITDDVRLGFLAGYSHSSFKVDDRRSSASSDNYHLGLYGGTQFGALSFRSGLAYTWSEIDTSRQVSFPGFSDSLTGSYRAGTTQVFGELGYSLKAGSVAFEPFANLAYVNVRSNGFAEQGGASALTVHGGSNDNTFTTLGLRAATGFDIGSTKATVRGMIGWRHAYGDVTPAISQAFTGSNAFTIAGAPIARDAAVIEAGLDFAIAPQATLGLSYHGQAGSKASDHGVRADLNVRF